MRPIVREKEQNIVALIEKCRISREIVEIVGLLQSIVKKVRKQLSHDLELSKGGRPRILTQWERYYASCLVIVGNLETATHAT